MNHEDRVSRVALAFADHANGAPRRSLCSASVEILGVASAGLTIMTAQNGGSVCSSDELAGRLDELQLSLGEGPNHDAYSARAPVFEPDLEKSNSSRWPSFTPPALQMGMRGVFAFPLHAGLRCIGVLALYQNRAGALTADQTADGLLVADAVALSVLETQSRSESDTLATELSGSDIHRAEVRQASGMVSVQLGISVADAALRLRAHSYAENRSVADVARDVVARCLRLDDDRLPVK